MSTHADLRDRRARWSGTTLLRIMLSSHPRLYIPPESDFIPRLYLGRARAAMSPDRAVRDVQDPRQPALPPRVAGAARPRPFVAALPS